MNLLENLNPEQLKAATYKGGPLLIVAGAGTGKTTVITRRIAYLIERGLAASDEILAMTFTEKAAGEMEERLDRLLPMGYLDLWVSTFHAFGERILAAHGLDIGLPADFKLLNEFEQWALIRKNLDKFVLNYYRPLGNPTKFIHALVRHFSRLKDEDITPAEYLAYAEELKENLDNMLSGAKIKKKNLKSEILNSKQFQNSNDKNSKQKGLENLNLKNLDLFRISDLGFSALTNSGIKLKQKDKEIIASEIDRINEVANAYHVYQQLLLDKSAFDFGDLINYCLKLFRSRPLILEKYRRQFKYILLDEFQDTNWAQYELIKLLAAPKNNLTVVADDDQAIFKFRGASVSNILQFKQDYPKAKNIVLIKNYRNRQNILDLSYKFIQLNNPNRLESQLTVGAGVSPATKLDKKLIAQDKGKGEIELIHGFDLNDEVRLVVEKIADLKIKDKAATWNDFAILVRANESARDFMAALEVAGLPYQFLAARGLYSKPVIMDIFAYLKLLDNYHESPALYRVLNIGVFGFSYQELVNFNYVARKKAWSLYTVLKNAAGRFGADTQAKIDVLLGLFNKHTALVKNKTVSEIILAFLNDSGYLKELTAAEDAQARESTMLLNRFMKRVAGFEAGSDDKSVKAFLEELDLEIESGEPGALTPDIESGPEAIKIMTAHGAKGLEFKYVFIPNLVDKRFPTIERKEPIAIPDPLVKEILPVGDIHLEEERRLFYVAVTRAKAGVFFSWAPDYGGKRRKKPSRFLTECGLIKDSNITIKQYNNKTNMADAQKLITVDKNEKRVGLKLPAYFSYTQLAAFSNCPYQYRYAHVLKVPRAGKHTLSYGQTMHLTLQNLFMLINEKQGLEQGDLFGGASPESALSSTVNAPVSLEELLEIYRQSWIDDWYESSAQKEEYRAKGRASLKEFYDKHKGAWPRALALEQGINFKLNGYKIYGKIDRIDDLGNNRIQIVDYKTGSPKGENKLTIENKEQLLIYQLGIKQVYKQELANLQFYYLDNNSEVNFIAEEDELKEMEGRIVERIEKIEKAFKDNYFSPQPGPLCKYCDFNGICEFRKI